MICSGFVFRSLRTSVSEAMEHTGIGPSGSDKEPELGNRGRPRTTSTHTYPLSAARSP